jgi:replicative DNA helicase
MSELPYSLEFEQDTLGGFLFFPSWINDPDFEPRLKVEDFFDNRHKLIYAAMLELDKRDLLFWGEIEVRQELLRNGKLHQVGRDYLHSLAKRAYEKSKNLPHSHEPNEYAPTVKDLAIRRRIILQSQKNVQAALDYTQPFYKGRR